VCYEENLYQVNRFSHINLPPDMIETITSNPKGRQLTLLNRQLLEYAYPSEIYKLKHTPYVTRIIIITYYFLTEYKFHIIMSLCLLLSSSAYLGYFAMLKKIKITFSDTREVDKIIEYLVSQMKFKKPYIKDDSYIFKPSLYNYIIWTAPRFSAQIDGNLAIIDGGAIFIRRLVKLLNAFRSN